MKALLLSLLIGTCCLAGPTVSTRTTASSATAARLSPTVSDSARADTTDSTPQTPTGTTDMTPQPGNEWHDALFIDCAFYSEFIHERYQIKRYAKANNLTIVWLDSGDACSYHPNVWVRQDYDLVDANGEVVLRKRFKDRY